MAWTIGVDVGGTFTDFYALNEATGELQVGKRPSTPDDPSRAVLHGVRELAERHGIESSEVARLSHGTTVGTNALLQRLGGKVALVTTKGFRDLLEIGRQIRPHMYDLQMDYPAPLVPRQHRFELAERITADGAVHRAPDDADIAAVVEAVRGSGAEACAVCFLFAFLNPAHEQRVAEALRAAMPDLQLSLSSEVQPEFREYERFSTTVLNAYLQPVMASYIGRFESGLDEALPGASLGINQSSGGLMSPGRARAFPVRSALSGPAAGVIGALEVGRSADTPDVITLDMGGTSADVALIRNGRADISFDRSVADFPLRLPMIDIHTVGAGGGSIAWFDRDGLLKVGPRSAGAEPGPACYGRGGDAATVTDANLVLGRLSPKGLLGGGMALDRRLAERALEPIAGQLGFTVERTAHGVLGIVAANMVRAIRTISVERGHDPRTHTLMPFGGAGPLHARDVAAALDINRILVPPAPGIVCAQGLVVSDLKEDFVVSHRIRVAPDARAEMQEHLAGLIQEVEDWFAAESVPEAGRSIEFSMDTRYVGQNFELSLPIATTARLDVDAVPEADALRDLFYRVHETAYGYFNTHDPIEAINFRLTARGRLYQAPTANGAGRSDEAPGAEDHRPVWFEPDAPVGTPVYLRDALHPGQIILGPAVIEQFDTTTLVYPGDRASVDNPGNILIELPQ